MWLSTPRREDTTETRPSPISTQAKSSLSAKRHLQLGVGRRGPRQAHQLSGEMPHAFVFIVITNEQQLIQSYNVVCRIVEAGTYLNSTRHVFPDWGNATILNAKACYERTERPCVVPGRFDEESLRVTAMRLNETGIMYTRSYVNDDQVWVAYVEEPFDE